MFSEGPNTGTDFSNISDDGNGTYSTSYTPTETGTDEITIQLSGTNINGSPFTSEIISSDANAIAIQTQPGNTVAGASIEGPPMVEVTDDLGNPVEGVDVTVSEQGGYSFDSGMTTVPTDGSGIATFNDLEITAAGTYTLVFDAVGVDSNVESNQFDITAADVDASVSSVTASSPHAADGKDASTVTIELADQFGNAIGGLADGDFAIGLSGSGASSRTAVSETGTAGTYQTEVASTAAEEVTVTVTANGVQLEDQPSITFEVGAASALRITQQPAATTTAGQTIDGPPSVLAEDSGGNPVSGVEVAVSLSSGTFSSNSTTTAMTNSNGVAEFSNLVVQNAGTYTMEFTASELSQTSNSFDIIAADVDASVSSVTASSPHAADGKDASTVTIELADQFGNAIGGLADEDFAIGLSGSGASSRTAVSETGTAGTYQTKVTSTAAEEVTVTVTADGVQLEDQPSITFESGPAANIEIVTQPGQTATGEPISGPPAVLLTDAQNNPVNGVNLTVSEQGGYVFNSGTTTRATGMDGIATFDDLVINTVGTYTLEFALVSGGTSSATSSNSFNVEANTVEPSQSTVSANPATVLANGSDASTVTIELRDSGGSPIGGLTDGDFIIDVTGSAHAGTVSETTIGTYETTVTNMTAETVTVTVTVDGVTLDQTADITFETGSADDITINIQPSNTTAGQVISAPPAVRATDSEGNPVSEVDMEVSLSSGTFAEGTLTRMTDESGVATFDDLVINTAGTYTLEFALSSDETVSASSNSFDITAAGIDASVSSVTATSPDEFTNISTVTIEVADQFGNAIGGLNERDFDIDLSRSKAVISTSVRETETPGTYQMQIINRTYDEITVTVTVKGVTLDDTPEIEFDD
ncbi:MAG: invasin domain 3-containing protein [Balneolaceae bacterium]|nr:invasin domain 3-containing protein [Balneolaceae bacterium]